MSYLFGIMIIAAFCFGPANYTDDKAVYEWANITPAANYAQGLQLSGLRLGQQNGRTE